MLTGAILMVQFVAFAGALGLGRLAGAVRRQAGRPGLAGGLDRRPGRRLLPADRARSAQFYALAAVIGLVQGGTQALSRSLFSQLIPAGKEAEYYGFYEISDRGTSWLGPLAFGLTYQLTGSYRLAIVSLVIFFVAGFVAAGRAADPPGRRRGRQHPAGAPVTPVRARAAPRPAAPAGVGPGLRATGAGTRRRRTCGSSTARWTAGSRRWRCRSTTTSSRQGRHGLLVTQGDRSAAPQISSRVGLSRRGGRDRRRHRPAAAGPRPVGRRAPGRLPDRRRGAVPRPRAQVDQLAELVDESHVDVYAFGLTTDFRAQLFPGTQRLLEVADDVQRMQVEVLCWCGLPGLLNARVVGRRHGPLGRDRRRRRHRPGRAARSRRRRLPRRPLPGAVPAALRARAARARRRPVRDSWRSLSLRCSPVRGAPSARI